MNSPTDSPGLLKVLLLEDSITDADLISWELKRAKLSHEVRRVQSRDDFLLAVETYNPDVVLSDHTMPGYDGLTALAEMRSKRPATPFIFVSGTLGEDRAVESLKRGASDYVIKGDLARLPSAIVRAIKEKRLRHERETAMRNLRSSEAMFKTLAEQAPVGIVVTGSDVKMNYCNQRFAEMAGREIEELRGMQFMALCHPADRAAVIAAAERMTAERLPSVVDFRLVRPSGEIRSLTSHAICQLSPEGETSGLFGMVLDTTEAKAAEDNILRLMRMREVLSGISSAVLRLHSRDQFCADACHIAVDKGGFQMAWIALVRPGTDTIVAQAADGKDADLIGFMRGIDAKTISAMSLNCKHVMLSRKPLIANDFSQLPIATSHEEQLRRANVVALAYFPLRFGDDMVGLMVLGSETRDLFVGEELQMLKELADDIAIAVDHLSKAERLNYLAYYDSLTGLPNRALFLDRLNEQVEKAGQSGDRIGLLSFNLERFRSVNEVFGEKHGDELLQAVAVRLSSQYGHAFIGRLGGDTFGAYVSSIEGKENFAAQMESDLKQWLATPFEIANQQIVVPFRIGAAVYPDDAADADQLFQHANMALKQAKDSNERISLYTQEINKRIAERIHYETRLRHAAQHKQFVLHYQPKVNLRTGRIGSLEALMRWEDPQRGLVPPMEFIPMLEETGLIYDVGMEALQQAFDAHIELRERFPFAPYIAVNVSALQLQRKSFFQDMQRVIGNAQSNHGIDIEITESLIMHDIEANIGKLKQVRGQNVHIAIDDFGTGYSSLSYIAKLPIDVLKIDRSFIVRMMESTEARTVVSAIISLAHSLGLTVVAEGVETEEQLLELQRLKCDEAQGYYFCKPMPLPALIDRLETSDGIVKLKQLA